MITSRPSLLIIGHGSTISDAAHEAALQHAVTLRQSNRYGVIDVCFLTRAAEIPELPPGEIFLLPLFMSDGYFVATRIPEVFGLVNGQRLEEDRQLYLCDALGVDPELSDIIADMGVSICRKNGYNPKETHLLLVAHGSEKSSASAEATRLQQRAVERKQLFAGISSAYLNEPPFLEDGVTDTAVAGRPIILVGLFAAEGPHAAEDVPNALKKWAERGAEMRDVHYAGVVGVQPQIVRLIQLSITRRAEMGR